MNCTRSTHCAPAIFLIVSTLEYPFRIKVRVFPIDFNISGSDPSRTISTILYFHIATYSSLLFFFLFQSSSHWHPIRTKVQSLLPSIRKESNLSKINLWTNLLFPKKKKKRKKHKKQINTLDRNAWSPVQSHSWGTSPPLSVRVIVLDCSSDIYRVSPEGHVWAGVQWRNGVYLEQRRQLYQRWLRGILGDLGGKGDREGVSLSLVATCLEKRRDGPHRGTGW